MKIFTFHWKEEWTAVLAFASIALAGEFTFAKTVQYLSIRKLKMCLIFFNRERHKHVRTSHEPLTNY